LVVFESGFRGSESVGQHKIGPKQPRKLYRSAAANRTVPLQELEIECSPEPGRAISHLCLPEPDWAISKPAGRRDAVKWGSPSGANTLVGARARKISARCWNATGLNTRNVMCMVESSRRYATHVSVFGIGNPAINDRATIIRSLRDRRVPGLLNIGVAPIRLCASFVCSSVRTQPSPQSSNGKPVTIPFFSIRKHVVFAPKPWRGDTTVARKRNKTTHSEKRAKDVSIANF